MQLDPKEIARQKRQEQGGAQTLDDLIALGRARGYRLPEVWADYVLNYRKGVIR